VARNTATSQRITGTLLADLSYPCTLHCWSQAPNLASTGVPLFVVNAANPAPNFLGFQYRGGDANDPVYAYYCATGNFQPVDSDPGYSFSAGTWIPMSFTITSQTNYSLYAAGNKFTSTTSGNTPVSNRLLIIGAYTDGTYQGWLDDDVAMNAVWDAVLTDDEIYGIHKGISPRRVRPQSLVFYAPLVRNVQDISRNGITLTDTGTTSSDHPRAYGA